MSRCLPTRDLQSRGGRRSLQARARKSLEQPNLRVSNEEVNQLLHYGEDTRSREAH